MALNQRCRRCVWWAIPLALVFGLIGMCLAKGSIDRDFTHEATVAMQSNDLSRVSASSNWADLTLRGPANNKDTALALVTTMPHYSDLASVRYVTDPTMAPLSLDATVLAEDKTITLSGQVPTEQQKQMLVQAARDAGYPDDRIVNQLTVGKPAADMVVADKANVAVTQVATIVKSFDARVQTMTAHVTDTTLTVNPAVAFTPAAADQMNALLKAAQGAGITVTGSFAAPEAKAGDLQAKLTALMGRANIRFATASARIDESSRGILETAAEVILAENQAANNQQAIEVAGHTDNVGSSAANMSLSQRRADAVRKYLIGKGVPAAQLTAKGYGDTQPVTDNDTAASRAENRRIELNVQK